MKVLWRSVGLGILALALVMGAATAHAAKAYSADFFNVDIVVQPDGSARVTETVAFRFEGGPFTFAFRGIPTRYTDGISNIQVSEGGRVYTPGGTGPGQLELKTRNNSVEARWHFEETSDTTRTFSLTYQVQGVMRLEDGLATLRWGAVPPDHDYFIRDSRVTVRLPTTARVEQAQVLVGQATLQTEDQVVTVIAQNIDRKREVVVGVWAPLAAFTNVPPAWQTAQLDRAAQDRATLPWGLAGAGLILVVGGVALAVARSRVPSLPPVSTDMAVYSAPNDLAPALAATLVKGPTGAGLGTILELAKRGIIQVREVTRPGWLSQKSEFEFILRRPTASLAGFEQTIVEAAFSRASEPGIVTAKQLGEGLLKAQSRIKDSLNTELRTRGLIDPNREQIRNRFYVWAILFLAGAVLLGLPLIFLFRVSGILPALALGVLSAAAGILGGTLSVRTAEGERVAAAWTAFQTFLKRIADGQAPDAAGYLEAYLPYAAAFGMEQKWMKRYAQASVPIPVWFQPVSTTNGNASWVAFTAAMHSASSAAGASAAAGAGAAGGGSSGAG